MNIIIEGLDGSGKSTLAQFLSLNIGWPIVGSNGPPSSQQQFEERARTFLRASHTIFDRHTIISEHIYGQVRGKSYCFDGHRLRLYTQTYDVRIYCARTPITHIPKMHDTPAHLGMIAEKERAIRDLYERWALQHAQIIYHGNKLQVLRLVKGAII